MRSRLPVVRARRFTAGARSAEGRFSTHSRVQVRLTTVWETLPRPSMQRLPSHHADDIGAILVVPSGFVVDMRTTGVPQ